MILDIMLLACGIYIFGQNVRMKMTGKIPKGMINPRVKTENAPDIKGYINYIYIRGAIFGVVLIVMSFMLMLQSFVELPAVLLLLAQLLYIGTLIYYAVISVRAQNKFLFRVNKEYEAKKKSEKIKRAAAYVNEAASEEEKDD